MPDTDENLSHMGYIGTWNQDPCFLGKNSNGESISTFKYIYDNPHPEKEIDTISFERNPDEYLTLMLSEIEILKDRKIPGQLPISTEVLLWKELSF